MDQKQIVRARVKAQRAERAQRLTGAEQATSRASFDKRSLTELFTTQLISIVTQTEAKRVSCFVSVGTEPDTSGFLAWAREYGIEVLLPRSLQDGTLEWALQSNDPLVPGAFGIPEPTGEALVLDSADLIFAPAAAVDRSGTRLGWGRGYFDRALRAIRTPRSGARRLVYAVVFADEIFDSLPTESHDVSVDGAVTELHTISFG
ncbi:MAG: 5-formyltetrahydrofolate cyclo-ligase [Leucobacter sp.]